MNRIVPKFSELVPHATLLVFLGAIEVVNFEIINFEKLGANSELYTKSRKQCGRVIPSSGCGGSIHGPFSPGMCCGCPLGCCVARCCRRTPKPSRPEKQRHGTGYHFIRRPAHFTRFQLQYNLIVCRVYPTLRLRGICRPDTEASD